MFGNWVYRRRKALDLTQRDLARKVSCSLSMLRKIEREERRPSEQLAELLADHLGIDDVQRVSFLLLARGKYPQDFEEPILKGGSELHILPDFFDLGESHAPFVARERQIQQLHEQLAQALSGQGRIVFISGEAGQGKSSLMSEFAHQALDSNQDLLLARGWSDVYTGQGDPLLPFRDIFRTLAGDYDHAAMRGILNRQLAIRLAAAIPKFARASLDYGPHLIDTLIPGSPIESHLAHYYTHHPEDIPLLLRLQNQRARQASLAAHDLRQEYLFDEVSSTLNTFARGHPLMLLLDDLHWIDHSSAALLGHLSSRMVHSPILIVGSYRPEDLTQLKDIDENNKPLQHPLKELLSESMRHFGDNRIDLDHYRPGEELQFVNAVLDVEDNNYDDSFREQLANLTEGHPLFLIELLRDFREQGQILPAAGGHWTQKETISWESIPARVEGVIEKRLNRLPEDLVGLLSVGCVQGETFFAEVISQVLQTDVHQVIHRLSHDLDRQHRLIHEQGVRQIGTDRFSQYRFRHNLFQIYLYEGLAAAERAYLHEAVGNALEALYSGREDGAEPPAAQLARHFQQANLGIKAARYLLLAGHQAARLLAYEEATQYYLRGLAELENLDPQGETSHLHYELKLNLARSFWHSGRLPEAITAFQIAIETARNLQDPVALAGAVLAYEEPRWRLNLAPDLSQQYLREAFAVLGEQNSGLRVRLLVSLARSLLASGEQQELRATVDQALRIAQQVDDPLALCDGLRIKIQIDRRPETTPARLDAIQQLVATAKTIGDQERLADGLDLYVYDLLELGQLDQVDEMISTQRKVAEEIKQPFQMHVAAVFQTMRAILRGEFELAERLAKEAADISQRIGLADLDGIYGIHMFTIRREQGRLQEFLPLAKLMAAGPLQASAWRPGLALLFCNMEMKEECRSVFENLASDGFAAVPRDSLWVATLAYLCEVCAYLGDGDRAAILYELLEPYAQRTVVVGGATACYGSAGRFLGMLAMTLSDFETAERHLQEAIELDAAMQAWPWLAHSQLEYAALLLSRGTTQDRQRVNGLLEMSLSAAEKMGMAYLTGRAKSLMARYEHIAS